MSEAILDDTFCSPVEAQEIQAAARREMFPNAPTTILCKLCTLPMPNPVIEHGAFSNWCIPCVQSKLSKSTIARLKRSLTVKREGTPASVSKTQGANFTVPREENTPSSFPTIQDTGGKPQLTLSSYLNHG